MIEVTITKVSGLADVQVLELDGVVVERLDEPQATEKPRPALRLVKND